MIYWFIAGAIYLIGAYISAFISGYFDYEPVAGAAVLWPVYVAAFLVIGALMPFVWIGAWLYNAGSALRGEKSQ